MKLSKRQQIVVDRMQESWALCVSRGFHSNVWLQKNGCGRGGESEQVSFSTFHALYKRNLITLNKDGYPTECWKLKGTP